MPALSLWYTFRVSLTLSEIKNAFSGRLVGNQQMINSVCQIVKFLPEKIQKYVSRNVWFISSPDDAWAFTFRGSDIANRHLIVISDELLKQNEQQIRYTILHEIGHVMLGHENSIGRVQTQAEIKRQEVAADAFAKKHLNF